MSLRTFYLRKKFWFKDFLHGSLMWNAYKEIKTIYYNVAKGEIIRQRELAKMLKFVAENVPFYKGKDYKSLLDFPVVNKSVYLSSYDDFLVPYDKIPNQKGDLFVAKTSGSTGTPFKIPQDTSCRNRRIATIKFENELIDFHSFEPMMHLRSLKHYYGSMSGDIIYNADLNIYYVDNSNLKDDKISKIIDVINNKKIKVIRGYMTSLDIITRYAVQHNIELVNHPIFISVGELLQESLRIRIVDSLKCKIISQYGNEENGIFGQSDVNERGTTIRLNRANCIVEILKIDSDESAENGELGRIVITDLTNYAFPMIRYDIGDLAKMGEISPIGVLLSIQNLSGRKTDMICKPNGEYIDFFNGVSAEIYNNPKINQWQFVQNDKNSYTLRLNVSDDELRLRSDYFESIIKDILGSDANVLVDFVDDIPTLSSGKRKVVISEYNPLN